MAIRPSFFTLCLIVTAALFPAFVFASETNGTITSGGNNGYGWTRQAGWVNFGTTNGTIHITDAGITGYAWNNNYGWINMAPTNGGVLVGANGALSGYAWGQSLGWINFSGVSINSSGKFVGQANGTITGTLTFDCDNCSVVTDYRPQNARSSTNNTNSSGGGSSGGGGGGGGGGSFLPVVAGPDGQPIPAHINAYNVPLVILPQQSGTLEQDVGNGQKVIFDIPQNSVPSKVAILVYQEPLVSGINLSLLPERADLLNSAFYNITARDKSGNLIHSFSNDITITLPVPKSLQAFSDTGVYWLDEDAGPWRKVSGVAFNADNSTASFHVNHLTKFGIFRIISELVEPSVSPVVPETLLPRQPISVLQAPGGASGQSAGKAAPAELFDIRLLLDGANVSRVIDLVARVTFESFGRVPTPVEMNFSIVDGTGKEIWKSADTVTVETEKVFVKRFFDAPTLESGSYTLKLHTRYNTSVEDNFEQPFTIAPKGAGWNWVPWFVGGLVILLALLILAWWFIVRRDKEQEKKGLYTPL